MPFAPVRDKDLIKDIILHRFIDGFIESTWAENVYVDIYKNITSYKVDEDKVIENIEHNCSANHKLISARFGFNYVYISNNNSNVSAVSYITNHIELLPWEKISSFKEKLISLSKHTGSKYSDSYSIVMSLLSAYIFNVIAEKERKFLEIYYSHRGFEMLDYIDKGLPKKMFIVYTPKLEQRIWEETKKLYEGFYSVIISKHFTACSPIYTGYEYYPPLDSRNYLKALYWIRKIHEDELYLWCPYSAILEISFEFDELILSELNKELITFISSTFPYLYAFYRFDFGCYLRAAISFYRAIPKSEYTEFESFIDTLNISYGSELLFQDLVRIFMLFKEVVR